MSVLSGIPIVEFMHRDATKSNALKWLCGRLGVPLKGVAACGNADNDADMIAFAGLRAAVANASESCLNAAQLILPSNDNDGVAELIETIIYSAFRNPH